MLPEESAGVLTAAADEEVRRSLSVRAQLRLLASAAESLGVTVVALKGAVETAAGHSFYLADLDVWTPEVQAATALARFLEDRGYRTRGVPSGHHLAPRVSDGGVQIEIHTAIQGFTQPADTARTQPLAGFGPLRQLAPDEHAWARLWQTAVSHPERMTRIRDLLLVRANVRSLNAMDSERLRARIATAASPHLFHEVILAAEQGTADPVALYLLLARAPSRPGPRLLYSLTRAAASLTVGIRPDIARTKALLHPRGPVRLPAAIRSWLMAGVIGAAARIITADRTLLG